VTDRHRLLALLAAIVLFVVVGNQASFAPAVARPVPSQDLPVVEPTDPTPHIAIVYDASGRGAPGSFNELAWEGVKRAADSFSAALTEVTAGPADTEADREARLEQLAQSGHAPIFVSPADAPAVAKVAPKHKQTWFGVLGDASVNAPNVIGILFHDEQSAYLVGAAAALKSKTGRVGFVGASRSPAVEAFEAGFAAGAKAVKPKSKVLVDYLSTSVSETAGDPSKAKQAALALHKSGADVVFAADPASGSGVMEAAREAKFWAIGVGIDQHEIADGSLRSAILTSALTRADIATFTITMEVATGVPKDGTNIFGLERDGVGYATSGGFLDAFKPKLDALAAKIATGEILVPTRP
jgi:basic membrane protein A and related proteins